jgi:predicted deacylase
MTIKETNMEGPFQIDKVTIKPGDKQYAWLELTEDFSGPVRIPFLAVSGKKPGKCLNIVSGIFGDEYTGMETIYRLFRELEPDDIHGQIIAVPMANTPAFSLIARTGPDSLNMNRVSKGRPDGFLTEKIAHFLIEKIISHADYAVEIIDIGMYYTITAFAGVPQKGEEHSYEFAKAYGADLLWVGSASPNVFRNAVTEKGVEVFMTQLGGEGRCRGENVEFELQGLINILKYLQMIKGKPENLPSRYRFFDSFWLHSHTGGIFRPNIELRQEVKKGEIMGNIYNLLDQELEVIKAPFDGIVIGYRSVPCIHPGDWTVWVGRIVG